MWHSIFPPSITALLFRLSEPSSDCRYAANIANDSYLISAKANGATANIAWARSDIANYNVANIKPVQKKSDIFNFFNS